jgi:hypothetical protein
LIIYAHPYQIFISNNQQQQQTQSARSTQVARLRPDIIVLGFMILDFSFLLYAPLLSKKGNNKKKQTNKQTVKSAVKIEN